MKGILVNNTYVKISLVLVIVAICACAGGEKEIAASIKKEADDLDRQLADKYGSAYHTVSATNRQCDLNMIVRAMATRGFVGKFSTNTWRTYDGVEEYYAWFHSTNTHAAVCITLMSGRGDQTRTRRWILSRLGSSAAMFMTVHDITVLTNRVGNRCFFLGPSPDPINMIHELYFERDGIGCAIGPAYLSLIRYVDSIIQQFPIENIRQSQ